jgi:ribose transport system substrate-binding protein
MWYPLACSSRVSSTIAVIPRTTATVLWEPAHSGAEEAAKAIGSRIYWNAPTQEDDIARQISLVKRVIERNFAGLVVAPTHSLALIPPIRQAIAKGIPTVIIGSPLMIPPGGGLSYILNDDEEGGRIAAARVGLILRGRGSVALLGIDPDIRGIMIRARSFEQFLSLNYPNIHIVARHLGGFSRQHEQQVSEDVLKNTTGLQVIVALNWAAAFESLSAIESHPERKTIRVIAFDPDNLPFESENLDSVIMENTREMGELAVRLISAKHDGKSIPPLTTLIPVLITRNNVDTEQIRRLTVLDWRPESVASRSMIH